MSKGTHSQGGGVRVEDVDPELLECFLEDNVHHGVILTIFRLQVRDLEAYFEMNIWFNRSQWIIENL